MMDELQLAAKFDLAASRFDLQQLEAKRREMYRALHAVERRIRDLKIRISMLNDLPGRLAEAQAIKGGEHDETILC